MGKRGPAPKPAKILKLLGSGSTGTRTELPASGKRPPCPTWLSTEAKAEWRRITGKLEQLGIIDEIDRASLSAYCETWNQFYRAIKTLRKEGETFKTPAGYIQAHPAVAILNAARGALIKYAAQFGLTPSGRVGLAAKERESKDPLTDFARRKRG
jgi:P27 family predicted phage terminase small subunit